MRKKGPSEFRNTVLTEAMQKNLEYDRIADKRAQSMIAICAILIPLTMINVESSTFLAGTLLFQFTAVATIIFAIISQLPKAYIRRKDTHDYLFHYSEIKKLDEEEYMKRMMHTFRDKSLITESAIRDLYHMSTYILVPKFRWVKAAYLTFLLGGITSVLLIFMNVVSISFSF